MRKIMNWKKLQNGSDIRGIALEGVPNENVNLTAEATTVIAKAFITRDTQKRGTTWRNDRFHLVRLI